MEESVKVLSTNDPTSSDDDMNRPLNLTHETLSTYRKLKEISGLTDDNVLFNFLMSAAMTKVEELNNIIMDEGDAVEQLEKEAASMNVPLETIKNLAASRQMLQVPLFLGSENFSNQPTSDKEDSQKEEKALITNQNIAAKKPDDKEQEDNSDSFVSCSRCGRDKMTTEEMREHQKHCNLLSKYKNRKDNKTSVPQFRHCTKCGMRLRSTSEYKQHFNLYHANRPELYTCQICNKKQAFSEKRLLCEHLKTEPVCQVCGKRFSSLRLLHLHKQNNNHDLKREDHRLVSSSGKPTVLPALEAVNNSPPDHLPSGYSFMSVRLAPLSHADALDNKVVFVPNTANRNGYALQPEYLNPPYPIPLTAIPSNYNIFI